MRHRNGFRDLDRHECLRRLPGVPIGRIVYTHQALPAVLPVNFSLDHDFGIVIRTAGTSRFARAVDGVVVAFEADAFDARRQCGWSVVVTGRASIVTDPLEQERLRRTGPTSWAPTPDDLFVKIEAELVSGREIYPLEPRREAADDEDGERLDGDSELTSTRG